VASWLWWSCGPFTSLLWATVVLASGWVNDARRRRHPPLSRGLRVGQAVLGALLVVAAGGAALELVDPARLSTCGTEDGGRVLLALGTVLGASLLLARWPLRLVWALWTAVMLLWCGRSGTDCAGLWLDRAGQAVRGLAPREVAALERELRGLRDRVLPGDPEAAPGPDGSRGHRPGASAGEGTAPGRGPGQGGPGADGAPPDNGARRGNGAASGEGAASTDGPAPGRGQGQGGPKADGAPPDNGAASTDGTAPGAGRASRAEPPTLPPEEPLPSASEPRMSVEAALLDPAPFFGGGRRVTLSGDLLFEFDEEVLRPEAVPRLKQVARLLRLDPGKRVLLEGHADTIGGDAYNQGLSERRAAAVRTWLVEVAHINPSQIDTVGYGSSRPLVPVAKGPAAQQPNRRVEVLVLPP
jgi:outer membrane protein OmpA-like peptidoglycan-associated protein